MRVNRKLMINAVESSMKFCDTSKSCTLEILKHIQVDPEAGTVIGTDLCAYAISNLNFYDHEGEHDVFVCDPKLLIGILKTEKNDEINIILTDGGRAISIGESFRTIFTADIESFPALPENCDGETKEMFDMGRRHVNILTTPKATVYEMRDHVAAAYFRGDGKILSTDTNRLAIIEIPDAKGFEPFGLNKLQLAKAACVAKKKKIVFSSIKGNPYFIAANIQNPSETKILFPLYGEDFQFPDTEIIEAKKGTRVEFLLENYLSALKRAENVNDDEFSGIFHTFNGKLDLKVENPFKGIFDESIEYSNEAHIAPEIKLSLNTRFMLDALAGVPGEVVELTINEAGDPIYVSDPGDDAYIGIVMPMRM